MNYLSESKYKLIEIRNPFDSSIWNQYLLNSFYSYCFERFILPKINRETGCLMLTGLVTAIDKVYQKYLFIEDMVKQKLDLPSLTLKRFYMDDNHEPSKRKAFVSEPDAFNVIVLYSTNDKSLSSSFIDRLIDEGYTVYPNCSYEPKEKLEPKIRKSDLIIILFSDNYGTDDHCVAQLKLAQTIGKKIIPVFITMDRLESSWFHYINSLELYHILIKEDVQFELDENFDLTYDKLLVEMVSKLKLQ